jgi:hypothetical protein
LAAVFQQQRDADGGDEHVERGATAQASVSEPFDRHAEQRAADHGGHEHDESAPNRVFRHQLAHVETDESSDHEDIRVREVDEPQHAINHRVAEGDESVDRAEGETVEKLLEEFRQKG